MWTILALLIACGPKQVPEPAAEAPPEPPPAPAVVEEPPPPAEPAPPAPNASLDVTLRYADGRQVSGHVERIERGVDWTGLGGWSDEARHLTLSVERPGQARDLPWSEVRTLRIAYADREGISCQYDSDFSPWLHMCVLKTTSTVTDADGVEWEVTTRNPWRFTTTDGDELRFYAYKLTAAEQDSPEGASRGTENYDLYGALQTRLIDDAAAALTTLTVTP